MPSPSSGPRSQPCWRGAGYDSPAWAYADMRPGGGAHPGGVGREVPGGGAPDRERGRGGVQKCSGLKDAAQYGIVYVSRDDLTVAMRQAVRMVDFANEVIRR